MQEGFSREKEGQLREQREQLQLRTALFIGVTKRPQIVVKHIEIAIADLL